MQKKGFGGKKSANEGRVRFIVMNSIRALLIVAFLLGAYNERKLILIFSAIAFVVTFLPLIFYKLFKVKLFADVEIIVIFFIYGLLLFGEVHFFYAEFQILSTLFNVASAVVLGLVGFTVMYALYKGDKIHGSPLIIAIFTFCFAVAIGAVWEFFEYSMDGIFGFSLHKYAGDTMEDLIANMIGAFAVSSFGYIYIKNGRHNFVSKLLSKFLKGNPKIFGIEDNESIVSLIKSGENHKVEFKSTLRTNLHTNQIDKNIEHSALKTIAAYLNSNGGTLLIGVSDKGEINGLEKDNFENIDKLSLHFNNLLKEHIGAEYLPFIKSQIIDIEGKSLMKVECEKSPKCVFFKNGKEEKFYVRNGASSAELIGRALVDYINHNFN